MGAISYLAWKARMNQTLPLMRPTSEMTSRRFNRRPGIPALLLAMLLPGLSQAKDGFLEDSPPYAREERNAYLGAAAGTFLPVGAGLLFLASGSQEILLPGALLGIGGLAIGPSVGQFMAGSPEIGFASILFRTGGIAMTFWGMGKLAGRPMCESDETDPDGCGIDERGGYMMISLGSATYAAATVLSLMDTHQAYQRKRKAGLASLQWSPTLAFDRRGQARSGAAFSMTF